MGGHWKKLWILVTVLYFVANVNAQSNDENDEWSDDDYEDWSDRFDDIFKSPENSDDYQELLKKINDAKDRESNSEQIYEKVVPLNEEQINKDDTILNKSDPELQVEDARFLDIPDENNEVVGDENLNGNAPVNDFDPDEYDEEPNNNENPESASVQQHDEPESPKQSPYEQPPDINPDLFDTGNFDLIKPNKNKDSSMVKMKSAQIDSLEEELKEIFKETEDILKNDDDSNNFNDSDSPGNDKSDENIPEHVLEETQDILKKDSNDVAEADTEEELEESKSYESIDMNYEDLNEDLKALLDTLDKLENDDKENDSNKALDNTVDKGVSNEVDDLSIKSKQDDDKDSADNFEDVWRNDWSSEESSESKNAESKNANDKVDSSERDKQALADLNSWIEKQLHSVESLDNDDDDDYQDFYDDDDKDEEAKIENVAPIPYGNDAFDPNEPVDGKIEETDAKSLYEEEDLNDFEADSGIVKNDVQDENDLIDDKMEKEYNTKDKLIELNSDELYHKIEEFRADNENDIALDLEFDEIAPTDRILSLDEAIVERSPNYPEPYGGPTVLEWFYHGEGGSGIELNITDLSINGAGGDYLLFKPGRADAEGTDGLIFSYMLRHERRYRFFDVDSLFVKFEAKNANFQNFKGFKFSVKFIAPKVVRNTEPEPIPEPVAQRPVETMTVHLMGITHHEYRNISENFRLIVADMAAMYINRFGIDPGVLPLNEVTQLTMVTACNIAWPYHEACTAVTFGIPLHYNDTDQPYRLTTANLTDMWMMFSRIDPFETRLADQGITEYDVPNDRAIVSVWWLTSFVIMLFALSVGFGLWRFNCFQDYNGMRRLREETDSIGSARKSDLSLYPTPHQNLPPMFADGQYDHYLDGDYDTNEDSTRVDMGGAFDNRNFFRDGELMDLGSDEEIIMSLPDDGNTSNRQSYSSGIRPRDVYEV